jgi:hypothetical protein
MQDGEEGDAAGSELPYATAVVVAPGAPPIASHIIASHRISSHIIASHRIASHRMVLLCSAAMPC